MTLKITIHEDPNVKEMEITIVCSEMTAELEEIIANIGLVGHTFAGKKDGEAFFWTSLGQTRYRDVYWHLFLQMLCLKKDRETQEFLCLFLFEFVFALQPVRK